MTKSQDSVKSTDKIETIRYIRKTNFVTNLYDGWCHSELCNMHGITILFTLNFDTRTVDAQWSVCRKDNFNKKVGLQIARQAPKLTFPYELVDQNYGLTNALTTVLGLDWFESESDVYDDDYDEVQDVFIKKLKELKSA